MLKIALACCITALFLITPTPKQNVIQGNNNVIINAQGNLTIQN